MNSEGIRVGTFKFRFINSKRNNNFFDFILTNHKHFDYALKRESKYDTFTCWNNFKFLWTFDSIFGIILVTCDIERVFWRLRGAISHYTNSHYISTTFYLIFSSIENLSLNSFWQLFFLCTCVYVISFHYYFDFICILMLSVLTFFISYSSLPVFMNIFYLFTYVSTLP